MLETIKSLFITLYEPFLKSFVDSLRGGVVSDATEWDFAKMLDGWDKVFDKVVKKAEEGEAGVKVSLTFVRQQRKPSLRSVEHELTSSACLIAPSL